MTSCVCAVVDTNIEEAVRAGRPVPCGQIFLGSIKLPDGTEVPAMWLCHAAAHGLERPHDSSQATATRCCSPKILSRPKLAV